MMCDGEKAVNVNLTPKRSLGFIVCTYLEMKKCLKGNVEL